MVQGITCLGVGDNYFITDWEVFTPGEVCLSLPIKNICGETQGDTVAMRPLKCVEQTADSPSPIIRPQHTSQVTIAELNNNYTYYILLEFVLVTIPV